MVAVEFGPIDLVAPESPDNVIATICKLPIKVGACGHHGERGTVIRKKTA